MSITCTVYICLHIGLLISCHLKVHKVYHEVSIPFHTFLEDDLLGNIPKAEI